MEDEVTVLAIGEQTLVELVEAANQEHALAVESMVSAVEHAIAAGRILLECQRRIDGGQWEKWLVENFSANGATARRYMKIAECDSAVRESGLQSIRSAYSYAVMLPQVARPSGPYRYPDALRERAKEMHSSKMHIKEIARLLDVKPDTVSRWISPEYAQRARASDHRRQSQRRRLKALEAKAQHEREIKQVVRKRGGAPAELYAMAERMQDVMGQAHREATDPDERRHYALAGEHYRKMRDEIVRALGVS